MADHKDLTEGFESHHGQQTCIRGARFGKSMDGMKHIRAD